MRPLIEIIPLDYINCDDYEKSHDKFGLKPSDALHVASMRKAEIKHIVSENKAVFGNYEFDLIGTGEEIEGLATLNPQKFRRHHISMVAEIHYFMDITFHYMNGLTRTLPRRTIRARRKLR